MCSVPQSIQLSETVLQVRQKKSAARSGRLSWNPVYQNTRKVLNEEYHRERNVKEGDGILQVKYCHGQDEDPG